MKPPVTRNESGGAILVALAIFTTLSVCILMSLMLTQTVGRNVQRSNTMQTATEIGDGALELAFSSWRNICRLKPNQALATDSFDTEIPLPTAANFPLVPNFSATYGASAAATISNFRVAAVDPEMNPLASISTPPPAATGQNPGSTSYFYVASADVSLPVVSGNPLVVKVRRVFQKEIISPWNWAIFFHDDLEMHPGPPFTVTGWVHTNGTLYTGHDSLTFASKASYSQDWNIGFMPGDSQHPQAPTSPNWPSNLPPSQKTSQQPFGLDPSKSLDATDANPNNDSYHEYLERSVSGYSDPLIDPITGQSMRFYDQAGAKILIDASNVVTIKNAAGTTVTASSKGSDLALYTAISGAVSTNTVIQDNREQASVRLANLDVGAITTAINSAKLTNFNGIIYISDTSANQKGVGAKRGIRLKNGAALPKGGLTIASDNPVYIQGDYNTGSTSSAQPPSNSGDPKTPQVSGYARQPSAVMADAVMILSNAWSDSNSSSGLSGRVATNTTVNTAIMSGNVPSGNGNYSGGAENFPRFMEDWSGGVTFTYYGSMVQMYQSQQAIGKWGQDNVYSPPTRNWYFDTGFYTAPPPGTLKLINYNKHRWYLE